MTYGRIINEIKYMYLMNNNEFKQKSLEDNLYFTLRDIFSNAEDIHSVFEANSFNDRLSGGISFEERTDNFQYVNVLQNKEYVSDLIVWLHYFTEDWFEFIEFEFEKEPNINYIKYDDWWVQFEKLKKLLDLQLYK